jgi:ABC-type nickel/cobalt efflux system permease component RcnA
VALGLAGGLVPSPSAVVVLLAGFAIGRSWFALLLVVTFGLGMAVTLCVTGLLVVRVGAVSRRLASGASVPRGVTALFARLPTIAAASVIIAGLWIGVRSVLAL